VTLVRPLATTDADVPVAGDIPRFVEGLADGIRSMLSKPWSRHEIASAFLRYSWSSVFARYERVYQDALASPVSSRV
jgi:hypothetical protein